MNGKWKDPTNVALLEEENSRLRSAISELSLRLQEPEEIVRAIRLGEIDAVVVEEPSGDTVYPLRRADTLYREMIEELIPYGVWMSAPDGRYRHLSRSFLDAVGMTMDEAAGFGWLRCLPSDEAETTREKWLACVRSETPWEHEYHIVLRDGTRRAVLCRGMPVRDENGRIICWVGIKIDITARKEAEESLRQTNDRLSLLSRAAANFLLVDQPQNCLETLCQELSSDFGLDVSFHYTVDDDRQCLKLASYSGIPEESAQTIERLEFGQAVCGLVAQQCRARVVEDVQHSTDPSVELLRSLGIAAYVCHPLFVRGGLIGTLSFGVRNRPRFNPEELSVMQTVSDLVATALERSRLLSELQDRAEELAEADRSKDQFLATLAHELRNPLAPIKNSLDLMGMVKQDSGQIEELREVMVRQVEQMERLVDDLLDVARISRGDMESKKERVEISAAIETAVEAVRPLVVAADHRLTIAESSEPLVLWADKGRIVQAIQNLLTNAVRYTDRGGRIWLGTAREGDHAVLRVRDNGIGIAPEVQTRIFGTFVQVDQSAERSRHGLGIGLALVKQIAELHDGAVEVQSAGPGQGSEFILRLPLAPDAPVENDDGHSTERSDVAAIQRRVLVVDDSRPVADIFTKLLSMMGHEASCIYDPREAVDAIRAQRPEVVFSDISMPAMDGYALARQIRSQNELRNVILVALSGYAQREDVERSLAAGFDYHLTKPAGVKEVRELFAKLATPPVDHSPQ